MYTALSSYLKRKYGKSIRKICIDGGFTCPNRDGSCGSGGCIFCGERGAGEHISSAVSIGEQVARGIAAGKADGYIAYFQNFTNTYAPVEVLRQRYDSALIDSKIVVLAIGTRPDCISEEVCDLIASYKNRLDVWVELGLQTSSDESAERINRGYTTDVYFGAAELLNKYKIPFVTHMIIGLPGEGETEVMKTALTIIKSGAWGIKIHSLYVMDGTQLAEMYREKLYTPPTFEEYTRLAAKVIRTLPESMVVHRMTGDCPSDLLLAPEWSAQKNRVINEIRRLLSEQKRE